MNDFIKQLDDELDYLEHEFLEDTILIHVVSTRKELCCPYCGYSSSKLHSTYERSFQDIPINGKKSIVILHTRKMFCLNPECKHTTFAETFEFIRPKAKKSNRLLKKILDVSLNVSSVDAADILKDGIVDVSKSTICNLLKKRYDEMQ